MKTAPVDSLIERLLETHPITRPGEVKIEPGNGNGNYVDVEPLSASYVKLVEEQFHFERGEDTYLHFTILPESRAAYSKAFQAGIACVLVTPGGLRLRTRPEGPLPKRTRVFNSGMVQTGLNNRRRF